MAVQTRLPIASQTICVVSRRTTAIRSSIDIAAISSAVRRSARNWNNDFMPTTLSEAASESTTIFIAPIDKPLQTAYSLVIVSEKKDGAASDDPTVTPTVKPAVSQQEINRVMRELASRGGRSKSPRKLAALAEMRRRRWEGHSKPTKP